jgi:hypothetical protein
MDKEKVVVQKDAPVMFDGSIRNKNQFAAVVRIFGNKKDRPMDRAPSQTVSKWLERIGHE